MLKSLFHKQDSNLYKILTLAAIFFSLTLIIALNRYYSFYTTYDHGLFNQLFWNGIHGRLFQGSLSSGNSSTSLFDGQVSSVSYIHLGQHFVLDLLLWLPFYALFPSPVTLIVLQVGLITLGGLVLYFLSCHYLTSRLSVFIVASYYGANPIIGPCLDNFYEQCQIPLLVFSVLLTLEKRSWKLFWLLVALTLGVREDTGIILFGIGVYLVLSRRYIQTGLALCLLSFCYVVIVTNILMPIFSNDNSRLYLAPYFSHFIKSNNPTTLELLWAIISQPQVMLQVFFGDLNHRLRYILGEWQPLAFVPAFSASAWTIAGFPLLETIIQNNKDSVSINTRYTLTHAPGLFYGAILWWDRHPKKFQPWFRRFWISCIVLSLVFVLTSNPHQSLYFLRPFKLKPWVYVSLSDRWNHAAHLRNIIQTIPENASVASSGYVIPHMSNRQAIIRLPSLQFRNAQGLVVDVDYALVDLWQLQQPLLTAPVDRGRLKATLPLIEQVLQQEKYGIIDLQDNVLLLQKGVSSKPQVYKMWISLRDELGQLKD